MLNVLMLWVAVVARQNMMQAFFCLRHVVRARVLEARVGTEASHEEQLKSVLAELQDMFPAPNDTSR